MRNKGYILTWDALLALTLVLLTLITLMSLGYFSFYSPASASFEKLHSTGEDALDVLNKNGILEEIIFSWSQGDNQTATATADYYFQNLEIIPPKFGYRLEIAGNNISERSLPGQESDISARVNVLRFISGFSVNQTPDVYVARAWLLYNDVVKEKIYSLESVSYGNSFRLSSGANWTINHLGGSAEICIPAGCSGDDEHTYNGNPLDSDDALDDAIYRLLDKLDTDVPNDGQLDIDFDPDTMEFKTSSVATKQLGAEMVEVKLVLWV